MTITITGHHTSTYSYTDHAAPHGITTWWGWACSCGDGDTGLASHETAQDVTRCHRERHTPCTCGEPTIVFTSGTYTGGTLTASASCRCGFAKKLAYAPSVLDRESPWDRLRRQGAQALREHSCCSVGTSNCPHPAPAVIKEAA